MGGSKRQERGGCDVKNKHCEMRRQIAQTACTLTAKDSLVMYRVYDTMNKGQGTEGKHQGRRMILWI